MMAGGKSHPRCASGGCSVYRKNGFVTSMVTLTVSCGGRLSVSRGSGVSDDGVVGNIRNNAI